MWIMPIVTIAHIEIHVLIDSLLDVHIFLHVVGNRDI